jgi:NADH-quinone oxidoreductase subunit K
MEIDFRPSFGVICPLWQFFQQETKDEGRRTKDEIMVPLSWYLGLSALLFTIGAVGVIIKRNTITIFLCIELMLNAVNLTFVSLSSFFKEISGQLFVFIVMTVAAAEAAVGLAIIISIFRNRASLNVDEADNLKM